MRKTNTFEVKDIGEFSTYPIKQKSKEFKAVNQEGEEIKKEVKEKGNSAIYVWVDSKGNEYKEEKVFYDISGKKIQKINKTEKVNNYELCDREEIFDFVADSYYCLECNETTERNFNRVVKDKAIRFIFKKSSRGFKFSVAYITKYQKQLLMITGIGKISNGVNEFKKMKQAVGKKAVNKLKNVVEVKAEDLENEILAVM